MKVLAGLRKGITFLLSLSKGKRAPGFEKGGHYPWEAAYPDGVSWRLDIEPKPLFAILDDSVAAYPDKPCSASRRV
jgi:hypothetical protein